MMSVNRTHQKEFLSHFETDLSVRKLFITLRDGIPDSTRIPVGLLDAILGLSRKIMIDAPPQLWSTYETMQETLESLGARDEQLTKDINQKRIDGIELRKNRPQPITHKLENWVDVP